MTRAIRGQDTSARVEMGNPNAMLSERTKEVEMNKVVIRSLLTWQNEILYSYILSGVSDRYSFKELRENIPYFPKSSSKVNDFLINFIWEGDSLGKVVKENGINVVLVNDKFKPIVNKSEEL